MIMLISKDAFDAEPILSLLDLDEQSVLPDAIISTRLPGTVKTNAEQEGDVARHALLQMMGASTQSMMDQASRLQVDAMVKAVHQSQANLPSLASRMKRTLLSSSSPHLLSITGRAWAIPLHSAFLDDGEKDDRMDFNVPIPEWMSQEDDKATLNGYARSLYKHKAILEEEISSVLADALEGANVTALLEWPPIRQTLSTSRLSHALHHHPSLHYPFFLALGRLIEDILDWRITRLVMTWILILSHTQHPRPIHPLIPFFPTQEYPLGPIMECFGEKKELIEDDAKCLDWASWLRYPGIDEATLTIYYLDTLSLAQKLIGEGASQEEWFTALSEPAMWSMAVEVQLHRPVLSDAFVAVLQYLLEDSVSPTERSLTAEDSILSRADLLTPSLPAPFWWFTMF
ncbi:hypothetical protein BJ684DRAFT_16337 [Piptocephalis cylindrospora]|uniref:Uncharacterized protein n=1 Tax=Piptocephalis cylindrospora TaxID=1907219 RepID=A0A4V1IY42_9FUNG|nr:hypothetical protein BJ684DRAFT_16337 [Piptocephalis cylindrospora]|eukprot:RKP13249.1 hypothetical protein BJ684DRAFT_16337 [Piptocephalis cylindrospora]